MEKLAENLGGTWKSILLKSKRNGKLIKSKWKKKRNKVNIYKENRC